MCLCVSRFRFSVCLSHSVSFLPSLCRLGCVCVCVCARVWRNVPDAPENGVLHVGLSLVSLPLRLCLGHASACQAFSRPFHFGIAKTSTT
ncbi:hypothetical protein CP02DC21_1665 [Chlamydia psittaci 02DC21]|nr:hypothetical protein CP02DC21_1665 [Chlamydia psittaci 02DC21]